jgi:hypothetical protein
MLPSPTRHPGQQCQPQERRHSGKLTVTCKSYTPIGKNSLLGKADIYVREIRLTIHGVLVLKSNGRMWVSLPSPAMLDKDGVALRDDRNKIKYSYCFEFDNKQIRDAFGRAVINAVLARAPSAFDAEGAA